MYVLCISCIVLPVVFQCQGSITVFCFVCVCVCLVCTVWRAIIPEVEDMDGSNLHWYLIPKIVGYRVCEINIYGQDVFLSCGWAASFSLLNLKALLHLLASGKNKNKIKITERRPCIVSLPENSVMLLKVCVCDFFCPGNSQILIFI